MVEFYAFIAVNDVGLLYIARLNVGSMGHPVSGQKAKFYGVLKLLC